MSTEGWRAEDAGWILASVRVGLPGQSPRLSRKWRKHDSPKDFETVDNLLTLCYLGWLSLPLKPSPPTPAQSYVI